MGSLQIENIKVNFERTGNGKTTIVFLHGASCSSDFFKFQMQNKKLSENYDLISVDFPGHGNSGIYEDTSLYSIPHFADVLVKLYKELGIEDSILVGNSIGGNVILQSLSQLNGVSKIMLVASSPAGIPPAANMYLPNPNIPFFFIGKPSTEEVKVINDVVFSTEEFLSLITDSISKSDSKLREAWFPNSQNTPTQDEVEILKNLEIPVAVVYGKNEAVYNLEYMEKLPYKNLWKDKVQVIANTKHFPFLEAPEEFNRLLINFVS